VACIGLAALAASGLARGAGCEGPLPTDENIDAPGTDACPAALPALECAETFYLRQDGSGRAPKTAEGAFGPAQFNDPSSWHAGPGSDGKIGAGDCVQVIGTVQGPLTVHASGTAGNPIVLVGADGREPRIVGSEPFRSSDYVWLKASGRSEGWYTEGAKRGAECTGEETSRCKGSGLAKSLGIENCRVLWVRDDVAASRRHRDFIWAERGGAGDRLTLVNPRLVADPNAEDVSLRCAQHTGGKSNRNSCGARAGEEKYFCEGYDFPPENFALYVGNHSHVEIRSLSVDYANVGIGFLDPLAAPDRDNGHNSVRCVTFREVDKFAVMIGRQRLGHESVLDSAFHDVGNGIYVTHPDGASGHAFCGNVFFGVNEGLRNGGDGHAVGLQQTHDVAVEWNHIENARKPIALWAWRLDPAGRTTHGVKVSHNHIVDAVTTPVESGRRTDGAGIILVSGDAVYGNEISDNLIEDDPADRLDSLVTGIWAGGSGSFARSRAPNRFLRNTIVGAQTSIVIGADNASGRIEGNISYRPRGAHVSVEIRRSGDLPEFDGNLYYPAEGPMFQLDGKRIDFGQWQTAVKGDEHSLVADPEFENAAARDYRLQDSSPARSRGMGVDLRAEDPPPAR
jgi:hypothetical protein